MNVLSFPVLSFLKCSFSSMYNHDYFTFTYSFSIYFSFLHSCGFSFPLHFDHFHIVLKVSLLFLSFVLPFPFPIFFLSLIYCDSILPFTFLSFHPSRLPHTVFKFTSFVQAFFFFLGKLNVNLSKLFNISLICSHYSCYMLFFYNNHLHIVFSLNVTICFSLFITKQISYCLIEASECCNNLLLITC